MKTDNRDVDSPEESGLYFLLYLSIFYIILLIGDFVLALSSVFGRSKFFWIIKGREFLNIESTLYILFKYIRPFFGSLLMLKFSKYYKNNILGIRNQKKTISILIVLIIIVGMFISMIDFEKPNKKNIYSDSDTIATGSVENIH